LRGEKIDIIPWTDDPRVFIGEALNPASIEKVGIDEQKKSALVVVADSQLSLAIGKNGQNVRLAAKLTGWKIDIISSTEYEKEKMERDREIKAALAEETANIAGEASEGVTGQPDGADTEEANLVAVDEVVSEDPPSS
jgi:N utilization substance protein A